jgi:hypothetical protein
MTSNRVLVTGVILTEKENHADAIMEKIAASSDWQVELKWHAVGTEVVKNSQFVVRRSNDKEEKFKLINRILDGCDLSSYEYVVVCDDDIEVPDGFLNSYLEVVVKRNYSLSQPARSHNSYTDHHFVSQLQGVESRETRFVEIGPIFCVHKSAYPFLLPFDQRAPMGWGLDFHWPVILAKNNLSMGIIDEVAVEHSLRKPVAFYSYQETQSRMQSFLGDVEQLSPSEAFSAIKIYSKGDKGMATWRTGNKQT